MVSTSEPSGSQLDGRQRSLVIGITGLSVLAALVFGIFVVTSRGSDDGSLMRADPGTPQEQQTSTTEDRVATPATTGTSPGPAATTTVPMPASTSPPEPTAEVAEIVTTSTATTTTTTTTTKNPSPPETTAPAIVPGDLGLSVAMSQPFCDDSLIVLVAASVTPDRYRQEIGDSLDRFVDSGYLRTAVVCSSLRPQVDGNDIYVVYYGPFPTARDACDVRDFVGGDSYVKRLNNVLPDNHEISC